MTSPHLTAESVTWLKMEKMGIEQIGGRVFTLLQHKHNFALTIFARVQIHEERCLSSHEESQKA